MFCDDRHHLLIFLINRLQGHIFFCVINPCVQNQKKSLLNLCPTIESINIEVAYVPTIFRKFIKKNFREIFMRYEVCQPGRNSFYEIFWLGRNSFCEVLGRDSFCSVPTWPSYLIKKCSVLAKISHKLFTILWFSANKRVFKMY